MSRVVRKVYWATSAIGGQLISLGHTMLPEQPHDAQESAMKRWKLAVLLVVVSLVSFLCGGIFISRLSPEDRIGRLERLQGEAVVFFYDTMRELFLGTYDQQKNQVSAQALGVFNTYRARLEPKCWLVNTREVYGAFWGEALFPSGDVIEVCMEKSDKGWVVSLLNHMGDKYFFHDLSEVTWKGQSGKGASRGNRQK
jgi:uncharacterized protein YneF (UPF0154 family)